MKSEVKSISNLLTTYVNDNDINDKETLQYLLQRFLPHENECVFNWAFSSHIELKTNLFTFITLHSLHAEHIPLAKLQKNVLIDFK